MKSENSKMTVIVIVFVEQNNHDLPFNHYLLFKYHLLMVLVLINYTTPGLYGCSFICLCGPIETQRTSGCSFYIRFGVIIT